MNKDTIIANSLGQSPVMYAFDVLVRQEFSTIPIEKLLIYFIDIVPADLLPLLAEQFDVMGVKGWDFADTDQKKRDLIKKAIDLHRYKGTPWAVEEAAKTAGLTSFTLAEGTGGHWAKFRLYVDINVHPVNTVNVEKVVRLVNEYKNVRSWFEGIFFTGLSFDDSLSIDDSQFNISGNTSFDETISLTGPIQRDGSIIRNATQNYMPETDVFTVRIV